MEQITNTQYINREHIIHIEIKKGNEVAILTTKGSLVIFVDTVLEVAYMENIGIYASSFDFTLIKYTEKDTLFFEEWVSAYNGDLPEWAIKRMDEFEKIPF